MAIVTSQNKKTNTINAANIGQLDNVFNSQEIPSEKNTSAAGEVQIKTATETAAKKPRKYTDTVILNLPEGERSSFKAFCAKYNLTMTDFIYFSMDFIREKVEEGRFSVSRGGIKELKNVENQGL